MICVLFIFFVSLFFLLPFIVPLPLSLPAVVARYYELLLLMLSLSLQFVQVLCFTSSNSFRKRCCFFTLCAILIWSDAAIFFLAHDVMTTFLCSFVSFIDNCLCLLWWPLLLELRQQVITDHLEAPCVMSATQMGYKNACDHQNKA